MMRSIKKETTSTREDFRIELDRVFDYFISSDQLMYNFPSTLDSVQRKYIHQKAQRLGLVSKSHGKEPNRSLRISKKTANDKTETFTLDLSTQTRRTIKSLLCQHPLNNVHVTNVAYASHKKRISYCDKERSGRLLDSQPSCPGASSNPSLHNFRNALPITAMKDEVLRNIITKSVTIVCSETGSGKTTQIPQYILEHSTTNNLKCRVICTQPRRISAVSVAHRVADERNESIGQTVGFQIRLESCTSPKTALLYCTNGVLLRTLMAGDLCLSKITHIIIDEIHERDQFSDFLLISLRECLINYRHLRLILMSATMNVELFETYFKNLDVGIVSVPGRQFPVQEYFLEDILQITSYCDTRMLPIGHWNGDNNNDANDTVITTGEPSSAVMRDDIKINMEIEMELQTWLVECTECGTDDSFAQIMQLFLSENVPVNYQHPQNGYCALIAAAMHGNLKIAEQLITYGARLDLQTTDGRTAYDWAVYYKKDNVADFLKLCANRNEQSNNLPSDLNEKKKMILNLYNSQTMEDFIDFDLLIEILIFIMNTEPYGGILVFLPGYDDILTAQQRIAQEEKLNYDFELYMLHSSMDVREQQRVFERTDKRKVILSTNIAETSVTINDVVFVVDSGKVKEKSYDAMNNICTLKSTWISQACAKQRAGRAGRIQPGTCFHMFSCGRYQSMLRFNTPEILRLPLRELCLQTKKLAPDTISIAEFLSRAVEAPSVLAIQKSVESLIELGALDEEQELTMLGNHLLQLSVDPHLGKMLLYSVVFKCVDPILTIVSCLSQKDPFILPMQLQLKQDAFMMRKLLGNDSFSDHLAMLKAFQFWQESRATGKEGEFCNEYYVSSATMEMIVGFRSQLLGQLRAIGFVKNSPPDSIQELNDNSDIWPLVKAALAAGIYPNLAYIDKENLLLRTQREKKIIFHMSSILRNADKKGKSGMKNSNQLKTFPSSWVLFEELSRIGLLCSLKCVTLVSPLTVALVSSNFERPQDGEDLLNVNDWFKFECEEGNSKLIHEFKQHVYNMINKKIQNPDHTASKTDDSILKALISVLIAEDNESGFVHQIGVGARPKPFLSETRKSLMRMRNDRRGSNVILPKNKHRGDNKFERKNRPMQEQFNNFNLQSGNGSFQTGNQGFYQQHPNGNRNVRTNNVRQQNGYNFPPRRNLPQQSNSNSTMHPVLGSVANNYLPGNTSVLPQNTVIYNVVITKSRNIEQSVSSKTWIFKQNTKFLISRLLNEHKTVLLLFTLMTPNSSNFCGLAQYMGASEVQNLVVPVYWMSTATINQTEVRKRVQNISIDFSVEQLLENRIAAVIYGMYFPAAGIGRPILGSSKQSLHR